ncbi:NitT/TauT family transport system permease protein [Desulfobacula phenolica]|uniref:NitT/TauT family transport system permease protein n=1 Tax=Desulfobacula phenolica TaxID=90732 RepID=A0A1H2HEV8_9BACT|nr:NitT/TauT family transport system permease protein [Desulfobacula phenolica]
MVIRPLLIQGKKSLKSINRFIYKDPKQVGLNAVFGNRDFGWKFELIGLLLFACLWIAGASLIFTQPEFSQFKGFLPGPTFKALFEATQESRFWICVFASLKRIVIGILIAAVMGVPLGILVGFYPKFRSLSYSPIQFVRMISPLSWMPIALLLFASFESAVYFLIVMATICPIILNTTIGVLNINPQWIKMALNQGASNFQLIKTIVIPASLPYMLTSLRLALGVAWIVLVPAEFLGISSGLGYLINDARDTMEYDKLMAMIIAIGILGFALDRIIQKIQHTFSWSWNE